MSSSVRTGAIPCDMVTQWTIVHRRKNVAALYTQRNSKRKWKMQAPGLREWMWAAFTPRVGIGREPGAGSWSGHWRLCRERDRSQSLWSCDGFVSFLPLLPPFLFLSPSLSLFCESVSCVWLFRDPMDCSPPGPSVYRILQPSTLEWDAISFSRRSSQSRDRTWVSTLQADALPSEPSGKPLVW